MYGVKDRQKMLKELGLYTGKVDGVEGKLTMQAYDKLQKKYFFRKSDKDGKYGINTDKLLHNVYWISTTKNFDYLKDKMYCRCKGKYCSGSPVYYSKSLLGYLKDYRVKFVGIPMTITSGLRCSNWNKRNNGASKSRHLDGKALDFTTSKSKSLDVRKKYSDDWVKHYIDARYSYSNGYGNLNGKKSKPKVSSMGNSIHIDVI